MESTLPTVGQRKNMHISKNIRVRTGETLSSSTAGQFRSQAILPRIKSDNHLHDIKFCLQT